MNKYKVTQIAMENTTNWCDDERAPYVPTTQTRKKYNIASVIDIHKSISKDTGERCQQVLWNEVKFTDMRYDYNVDDKNTVNVENINDSSDSFTPDNLQDNANVVNSQEHLELNAELVEALYMKQYAYT
jgi:hypothetical protein